MTVKTVVSFGFGFADNGTTIPTLGFAIGEAVIPVIEPVIGSAWTTLMRRGEYTPVGKTRRPLPVKVPEYSEAELATVNQYAADMLAAVSIANASLLESRKFAKERAQLGARLDLAARKFGRLRGGTQ